MQEEAKEQFAKNRDSSVAWFKLAELVSRGEKEKALTLYRLLSHSFEERAYALQVEGDILWAFDDQTAVERYQQAAFLYRKEQKLTYAIAIYEHLLAIEPGNYEHLIRLVEFYARLEWAEKFKERFNLLIDLFEKRAVSQERVWQAIEVVVSVLRDESPKNKKKRTAFFKQMGEVLHERTPSLASRAKMLYQGPRKESPQTNITFE